MTAVSNGYYLSGSDGGVFTYPTTNGPTVLRLHGLHRAQQTHRGDLRITERASSRRPAYRVIADTAVSNRAPGARAGGPTLPNV